MVRAVLAGTVKDFAFVKPDLSITSAPPPTVNVTSPSNARLYVNSMLTAFVIGEGGPGGVIGALGQDCR